MTWQAWVLVGLFAFVGVCKVLAWLSESCGGSTVREFQDYANRPEVRASTKRYWDTRDHVAFRWWSDRYNAARKDRR